jgi:hypothetical protein
MNILTIIFGLIIIDLLPVSLIVFLTRFIFKNKLSKGWCVIVFILSTLCSFLLAMLLTGKPHKLGIIDYLVHFFVIKNFLYDESILSVLDTEKEIKEKRAKIKDADAMQMQCKRNADA